MIPVVLYWSVNTEHLHSTSSCTNGQHPLGDVSVSLLALSWHFSHVLDLLHGGTSAAHVGHAIPSWAALLVELTMAGGDRHTPCCWRGQVKARPCKHPRHCGAKESTTQIHRQSGNFVSPAVYGIVCVSLRSPSDLEFLSLHWHSYSNQGRQPESTGTMTLKCTHRDLHNTGVWILPEPAKESECNMSTLLVPFQDICTCSSAGPHTDFSRCGKTATLNCPSFLTLVEKEGLIKYLGESSSCQLYGHRHQKRLDGDSIRKKLSQAKSGCVGNPRKEVLLG